MLLLQILLDWGLDSQWLHVGPRDKHAIINTRLGMQLHQIISNFKGK